MISGKNASGQIQKKKEKKIILGITHGDQKEDRDKHRA